jgi:thioredoxin 1
MTNFLKRLFGGQPTSSPASLNDGHGPIHVGDADFAQVVLGAQTLAIVDLWADWCRPCHMLAPTITRLAAEYEGRLLVAKLDVDENPSTAGRYGVRSIPTVLFIRNGKEIDRMVGVQPYISFANRINRHLEVADEP